jgi:5-methylcytosine-specific restriction endonuclease McrA
MQTTYFNISTILVVIFFIILALIVIFSKTIKATFSQVDEFELFLEDVKKYLAYHYPAVKIDWNLISKGTTETDLASRQSVVVSKIIEQYTDDKTDFSAKDRSVSTNDLWSNYVINCTVKKGSLPKDWARRKQVVYKRDGGKCQKCACNLKYDQAYLLHITPPKEGGQHNLENLVILCLDCFRVSDKENPLKSINGLKISEDLMRKVKI